MQPSHLGMGIMPMSPGIYRVDGQSFQFEIWDFLFAPPGSRVELDFIGKPLFEFSLFSMEFADSNQDVYPIPLHSRLGDSGPHWDRLFRRGLNRLHLTKGPLNAVAAGIFWTIAETDRPHRRSVYVEEAERMIADRLGQSIRIDRLAAELGISQSQLNRLFLVDLNRTPLQYVQDLRAKRALELLANTVIPFKQVASECGFPDIHAFSRFVRNRLGASPRTVRQNRSALRAFSES